MEDLEKRAIEDLSVVSSVGFHAGGKTHKAGVYANLRCCAASSYGGCGAKLVGPIRKSIERPTTDGPTCIAAAQELHAAEKDAADASTKRPADEAAASLNANDVLMLHRRLKMIQKRAEVTFCKKEWLMEHVNTQINQVVVMYRSAEKVIRPSEPADISVCKDIMSYFSFLFLGMVRHYAKRPFSCWCAACSRVRGRGLGSQSSGPDLLVADCTRVKQTAWEEDQFTVLL